MSQVQKIAITKENDSIYKKGLFQWITWPLSILKLAFGIAQLKEKHD